MRRERDIGGAIRRRIGFEWMTCLRSKLNRLTGGRTGLYSTAEHHSGGPHATVLRYYQYSDSRALNCACGWDGKAGHAHKGYFDELFDVKCPDCRRMLLVVGYPTLAEIEQAAERGNAEAQRELARIREATGG